MRMRGLLLAAGACLVVVAIALFAAQRSARSDRARGAPAAPPEAVPGPSAAEAGPAPAPDAKGPFAERADALLSALSAGGAAAQDAAAELRRLLRTDEEARRSAEAALLDPGTPRDLRMALAFVLGTLHGSDAVLLDALKRFPEDGEFVRCALLALGAARDPEEEDEIFDLGDRPFGEMGPAGLGITVRREIGDAHVRAEIARHLAADEPATRRAAAVALRATTDRLDVRDAFLAVLRGEADDGVAGVVGEALAQWAGGTRGGGERSQVIEALLRRVGDEGLDGYRFRLEDDLARIPFGPAERTVLLGFARPPHPLGIRSFSLSALAASAARAGGEPLAEARQLLLVCLEEDADEAVRDLAARLLGKLPADESSVARLAQAASDDSAWRVRYAAVEALAEAGGPVALAALRAAASDADERVAERARELVRVLESR